MSCMGNLRKTNTFDWCFQCQAMIIHFVLENPNTLLENKKYSWCMKTGSQVHKNRLLYSTSHPHDVTLTHTSGSNTCGVRVASHLNQNTILSQSEHPCTELNLSLFCLYIKGKVRAENKIFMFLPFCEL